MTIKIIQRKDVKSDLSGKKPLLLEFCLKGKRTRINLGLSIPVNYWDTKNEKVKKGYILHESANQLILNTRSKAYSVYAQWDHSRNVLTTESFKKTFLCNLSASNFFCDYATNVTEKDPVLKLETLRSYRSHIRKITEFNSNLCLQDIDIQVVDSLERFLYEKGNNRNTVRKGLSFFRSIINRAIRDGLIDKNPFEFKKIGSTNGNRLALSIEQLNQLHKFLESSRLNVNILTALKGFLFCCYTGLRYSDFANFRYSNIVTINGVDYLDIIQIKTGRVNKIPLFKQARKLIDFSRKSHKKECVFKVFSNQFYNRALKFFTACLELDQPITFHCSRHTAACYWLYKEINVYQISCWLGHSSIKTTEIYLHYFLSTDEKFIRMVERKSNIEI